ncbi:hypothetical protein [Nocardia sp. NBC_01327]|uniref:hypothetical protein n=1 Tax=Nocardia sp. NBC_01327 TaxID=2903593 RepID=UPI002E141D9E|nr:hypothetical protein OG326_38135 [Nocardia sp. NBC_01327]
MNPSEAMSGVGRRLIDLLGTEGETVAVAEPCRSGAAGLRSVTDTYVGVDHSNVLGRLDGTPHSTEDGGASLDPEVRKATEIYHALGDEPPRVNIGENDLAHAADGAHTVERHGPDVPLNRDDAPPGDRTIEGRIYGDPPWSHAQNWSYRWSDASTMSRTINDYLRANWETVRSDLALDEFHKATFDTGHLTGEGFYNEGMNGLGPKSARAGRTSFATVVLNLIPGRPPSFLVVSGYPAGLLR